MNKNNAMKILIVTLLSALVFSLFGCKSVDPCPENPAIGNIGSVINTERDDRLPSIVNDTMFFTSLREDISDEEQIYKSLLKKDEMDWPLLDTSLPLLDYPKTGSPSFHYDDNAVKEIFFASAAPGDERGNRQIFSAVYNDGKWSTPIEIDEINTESYESHPSISRDGTTLVFSSDRPGGFGQTDLYVSRRNNDGTWSEPQNLGEKINTPMAEISPLIDPDGNLYYASKGYRRRTGYDIVKARPEGDLWANPEVFPFPVNTEFDETGPAVWRDMMIISSDRRGGCGGYDIYWFDNCGPVFLEGKIEREDSPVSMEGRIEVLNESGSTAESYPVDENGGFRFTLIPYEDYSLRYVNECMPDINITQQLTAPCSDSSTVKMILNIPAPAELNVFYLEKKNVPFFVTGYYLPNTSENLEALRLKFSYNLIGKSDSTKYIEKPGPEYDNYAKVVDRVMKDAERFILKKIDYLIGGCLSEGTELNINVTGFADPRPISKSGKYDGVEIDDPDFDLRISRGAQMNNELLSTLRAYFTAKELQSRIRKYDEYSSVRNLINWSVSGSGVDEREALSNDLKRRVSIEAGIDE